MSPVLERAIKSDPERRADVAAWDAKDGRRESYSGADADNALRQAIEKLEAARAAIWRGWGEPSACERATFGRLTADAIHLIGAAEGEVGYLDRRDEYAAAMRED